MATGRIKVETEIELSIETAAQWFAGITDDEQAKFFVEVARVAETFPVHQESQWLAVGNHLATCECSTEAAREMIRTIAYGMEHSWTKPPVNLLEKALEHQQ